VGFHGSGEVRPVGPNWWWYSIAPVLEVILNYVLHNRTTVQYELSSHTLDSFGGIVGYISNCTYLVRRSLLGSPESTCWLFCSFPRSINKHDVQYLVLCCQNYTDCLCKLLIYVNVFSKRETRSACY
jgi:hypothetical protein